MVLVWVVATVVVGGVAVVAEMTDPPVEAWPEHAVIITIHAIEPAKRHERCIIESPPRSRTIVLRGDKGAISHAFDTGDGVTRLSMNPHRITTWSQLAPLAVPEIAHVVDVTDHDSGAN
ncbi:MAG: hypothetical protein ACE5EV_03515, partial [Gaiellales bacterium]